MSITQSESGAIICTGEGITIFQLLALRGAVKMEARGMTRRGRSASAIAREQLGLSKRAPHAEIIEAINKRLPPVPVERADER